jgi:integrase
MALTTLKIQSLLKAGSNARVLDAQGLHLQLRGKGRNGTGRASWILRYVSPITHKTREMGLGAFEQVGLAQARVKAAEARVMVSQGIDPVEAKKPARTTGPGVPTFGAAAANFFENNKSRYRNAKVRNDWMKMMQRHCAKIWDMPVDAIDTDEVLSVIQPLWHPHNVTSRRVMHRISQVIRFSHVRKWRPTLDNPAEYSGLLEFVLPNNINQPVRHHPAIELSALPDLMEQLAALPGTAARAAEFCILTASRPGEVFGMQWQEVDFTAKTWSINGSRYKTGIAFTRPLSDAALAVLARCARVEGNPYAFISPIRPRAAISDISVSALFKRIDVDATLHGCARSLFSDHLHNETDHDHTMIELALGHSQNATVKAYWRTSPLAKLRVIFEEWADFCTGRLKVPGVPVAAAAE